MRTKLATGLKMAKYVRGYLNIRIIFVSGSKKCQKVVWDLENDNIYLKLRKIPKLVFCIFSQYIF